MIANLGNVVFSENKIEKYKQISNLLLLFGLFLIILFPFLGQETFIEEKHVKHSNALSRQISISEFEKDQYEYFSHLTNENNNKNKDNDLLLFIQKVFNQSKLNNIKQLFTKEFASPRGDKKRFIMINLIYEINEIKGQQSYKANYIIYSLMKFLTKSDRVSWLAKDIQFNYIRKEFFFDNPHELFDTLIRGKNNKKIINGQGLDSIINIDLTTFDLENINYLLIKQNGMNSENNDMDYYHIFTDNILNYFLITTNSPLLKSKTKEYIRKIIRNFGGAVSNYLPKPTLQFNYLNSYIYFLENVLDNFLLIKNNINFNHLLISQGFNSILFQVLTKKGELIKSKDFLNKGQQQAFNFLTAIQRSIKTISKNEIDLFRGQYHFVLVESKTFVGYSFLAIPVLMIVRIFYEVLHTVYLIEFKYISSNSVNTLIIRVNASKVLSLLLGGLVSTLLLFLHIHNLSYFFNTPPLDLYYYLIGYAFLSAGSVYLMILPNKREILFIDNILRFILALNCFNFIFINVGLGILITGIVLSLEMILILIEKINQQFFKMFILGFVMYEIIFFKELIVSMIGNYIKFTNNVYGIISITLILFAYRIVITAFRSFYIRESVEISKKNKID